MMICPDCKVERADYEGRLGAHLPICPHCGSGKVPSERPWNLVTFGDGSLGWLRPWGSVLRITEADGHNSCWHGDGDFCTRSGHETLSTYWVEPIDDIAIQKSDAEWMRKQGPKCLPHGLTTTTYGTLQRLLARLDAAERVCRAVDELIGDSEPSQSPRSLARIVRGGDDVSEELSEAELAELRERFKNWSNLAYNITSKEGMRLLATLDRATERAEKAEGELRKWTDGRGICVLNTFPHRKQNACVGWHAVAHPEAD